MIHGRIQELVNAWRKLAEADDRMQRDGRSYREQYLARGRRDRGRTCAAELESALKSIAAIDPSLPCEKRGPEWYAANDPCDEHG